MRRSGRIQQNFDVVFTLSAEDMATIKGLDVAMRMGWGGPKAELAGGGETAILLTPPFSRCFNLDGERIQNESPVDG